MRFDMGRRWDLVVSSKDKNDKYRNTKVGAVFEKDDGRLSIALDKGVGIAGGIEGVFITAFVPREREQGGGGRSSGAQRSNNHDRGGYDDSAGSDDDIPF
jgi:hypothetical protein